MLQLIPEKQEANSKASEEYAREVLVNGKPVLIDSGRPNLRRRPLFPGQGSHLSGKMTPAHLRALRPSVRTSQLRAIFRVIGFKSQWRDAIISDGVRQAFENEPEYE